jgi:hypothetical protein
MLKKRNVWDQRKLQMETCSFCPLITYLTFLLTTGEPSRVSKDVDAGKVAPSFKSQPEPTGTEDVKVVVANTLKKETIGVQNLEETLGPCAMGQLGQLCKII